VDNFIHSEMRGGVRNGARRPTRVFPYMGHHMTALRTKLHKGICAKPFKVRSSRPQVSKSLRSVRLGNYTVPERAGLGHWAKHVCKTIRTVIHVSVVRVIVILSPHLPDFRVDMGQYESRSYGGQR
jgi:hypothetical protein